MGIRKKIKNKIKDKVKSILFPKVIYPIKIVSTSKITAGRESYHNGNFTVKGEGKLVIGNYCAFGNSIKIILSNHSFKLPAIQYTIYTRLFNEHPLIENTKTEIEIGSDVWIGDNVVILPGVKIGDGVCIGAGSIVTKNIDDFGIAGGNPAKLIKYRFSDSNIKKLKNMQWWKMDEDELKKKKEFFFKTLK